MITRGMLARVFGLLMMLPACFGGSCRSASDGAARKASLGDQTRKKSAVTPEIIEKAEEILKQNPEAAIGSDFRFNLRGKRYTARIEQHENGTGDPSRPPGKHKGVTVYED